MNRPLSTQDGLNQPSPIEDLNLFSSDAALVEAAQREGAQHAIQTLSEFGALCGTAEMFEQGRLANENPPRLKVFDARGRRSDIVAYHPAYHGLMEMSRGAGLHASAWAHLGTVTGLRALGADVVRAAGLFMAAQVDAGHCWSAAMTNAAIPLVAGEPKLAQGWLPKLLSRTWDRRFLPHHAKESATLGIAMTERQGGSDLRASTTLATPTSRAGAGEVYTLVGHKSFLSAPMSDAFLVTAHAPGGLSCFFMPRFLPDGSVNAIHIQRLKETLGNRSNAPVEVEFAEARAWLMGEEGGGFAAVDEMTRHLRLDCAVVSAGLMRLALANVIHHVERREAFGAKLAEHSLMARVAADLALDVEAATALVFRLARSFDRARDPQAAAWRRVMTPVTAYWVCKRAPVMIAEVLECIGGGGYSEDTPLPRLFREAPAAAIWAGGGNILALDVLGALRHEPHAMAAVMDELSAAIGDDRLLRIAHGGVEELLQEPRLLDERARALVDMLARVGAGAILRSHAPQPVSEAFIAARLGDGEARAYGHGLAGADTRALIARASPLLA